MQILEVMFYESPPEEALDIYSQHISSIEGVLKLYLFWSRAYGKVHSESDIDLFVVIEDCLDAMKFALEIQYSLKGKRVFPLDVMVGRESDFMRRSKGPTLQQQVMEEGVLLYECVK